MQESNNNNIIPKNKTRPDIYRDGFIKIVFNIKNKFRLFVSLI